MMGIFRREAVRPATSMPSIHGPESVPMLRTRASAREAISSISSTAWAMTGEAPSASKALAVYCMTT